MAIDPLSRPQVGPVDLSKFEGVLSTYTDQDYEDPSIPDPIFWQQSVWWEPIRACLEGLDYLKANSARYLPKEPREQDEAYKGRVARSVFSPYLSRVIRTATGLILRKSIILEGGDEAYWEEFRGNCDRQGTDLDEFVRNQLFASIAWGHSSWLVDFPDGNNIRTLKDQYEAELKPYFVNLDPTAIIGWRQDARRNAGKLEQVRIREMHSQSKGRFGSEYQLRIRVLEPGRWEVYEQTDANKWIKVEEGKTSLKSIPLVTTYSNKLGVLCSKPPLAEVAHLNLAHYARHADLIHALHIAAQPVLVLKGYDDQGSKVGLSVNNAIVLPPEGDAFYVEPASSAFDAQRAELEALAEEISTLGLAVLTKQKSGVESGLSKSLDRVDSNAMLSVISKDLEQTLQAALDLAGEYAGVEPPIVRIHRDFDLKPLEGSDVLAINTIFESGLIDQVTALTLLQKGEILDDTVDLEEIADLAERDHDLKLAKEFSPRREIAADDE